MSALRLRNRADRKSLLWLALATTTATCSWHFAAARPFLLPIGAYFSFSVGLIAHGHNHCPMFRRRSLNQAVNLATTAFFGFPTFVWVAGHNGWHHRFNNGPGDPSAGWRISKRHNLATAIIAPIAAMIYEPVVVPFLREAWCGNRRRFRACMLQVAFYIGGIAIGLYADWRAFVWAFATPWAIALFIIHYFNYIQHVHCDPSSEFAHSRDWTGSIVNFFTFNQGFHTVHHNQPGAHWSEWRTMHERVRDRIPTELQSDNMLIWILRQYLLAPFRSESGTRQIGTPPWTTPARASSTFDVPTASGDSL